MPQHVTVPMLMHQPTSLPLLGHIVTWRVRGCALQHSVLAQRLQVVGLDRYLPKPPSARVALRRAIATWIKTGQSGTIGHADFDDAEAEATPRRALIRYISSNTPWITFGVILEAVDRANLGLDYMTELRVFLNTQTDHIILSTDEIGQLDQTHLPPDHPSAAALNAHWVHFKNMHLAGDLSALILHMVTDLSSMPLRHEGGVYFVPTRNDSTLTTVRHFVEGLPTGGGSLAYLIASGVVDETEARRNLSQAVHAGFVDQITAFANDFADLRSKGKSTRPASIAERLTQYRRFKDKLALYADLLSFQQTDIQEGLDRLHAQALAVLDLDMDSPDETDSAAQTAPTATAHPDAPRTTANDVPLTAIPSAAPAPQHTKRTATTRQDAA